MFPPTERNVLVGNRFSGGEGGSTMPGQKFDINMEYRRPVGELFTHLSDHEKMGPGFGTNVKMTVQAHCFFPDGINAYASLNAESDLQDH
jgi:hypothetical protein